MQRGSKTSKNGKSIIKTSDIRSGEGSFNFSNGDRYEGNYVVINNKEIYRQDHGIYKTNDGDEYRALWDKDCVASEVHVLYGSKAEYRGGVDEDGAMSGYGTYTFPDGSSVSAVWRDNQPIAGHVYVDPLGRRWLGRLEEGKREVAFSPEHGIWDFDALD